MTYSPIVGKLLTPPPSHNPRPCSSAACQPHHQTVWPDGYLRVQATAYLTGYCSLGYPVLASFGMGDVGVGVF